MSLRSKPLNSIGQEWYLLRQQLLGEADLRAEPTQQVQKTLL
jgi:hypothetical protein